MKSPTYKHPDFVIKTEDYRNDKEGKRYFLKLVIDKNKTDSIIVIMKNPSRASKDISDKTIFNVTNYIHKNSKRLKELKNIGVIIILNLIPYYETYSDNLIKLKSNICDTENINLINKYCSENRLVIAAWGNHPSCLRNEYENIKSSVFDIFLKNKNSVFYVDKLSKHGNPKHGQIWAYENVLKCYNFKPKF